jgi:XTP/dITP diphosphohydrolase
MFSETLYFASGNPNKIEEVSAKMHHRFRLLGLHDLKCTTDLPETGNTLEANARQKAQYVWDHYHVPVFADDTGLEIDALNGEPGVNTAFYGGPQKDAALNKARVLRELEHKVSRRARFRTVICLIIDGNACTFEGVVNGTITTEEKGSGGFGYDSIFQPEGSERTFAQMTMDEKNTRSHRAKAVQALESFLAHWPEAK